MYTGVFNIFAAVLMTAFAGVLAANAVIQTRLCRHGGRTGAGFLMFDPTRARMRRAVERFSDNERILRSYAHSGMFQ